MCVFVCVCVCVSGSVFLTYMLAELFISPLMLQLLACTSFPKPPSEDHFFSFICHHSTLKSLLYFSQTLVMRWIHQHPSEH